MQKGPRLLSMMNDISGAMNVENPPEQLLHPAFIGEGYKVQITVVGRFQSPQVLKPVAPEEDKRVDSQKWKMGHFFKDLVCMAIGPSERVLTAVR